MNLNYNLQSLNYEEHGSGEPVILLHGWGASLETMRPIVNELSQSNTVFLVDLPGFGKSPLPPDSWGIFQYAALVTIFCKEHSEKPYVFIGHSFGGRISILCGALYKDVVKKIILVDAAGIKPKRSIAYYIKIYFYKTKKFFYMLKIILYWLFLTIFNKNRNSLENYKIEAKKRFYEKNSRGSEDYKKTGDLKPVFLKVVNQHLNAYLSKISAPTLLFWGENDRDTPLYMAHKMEKEIKDCGLVVLKNAGHYSYLDQLQQFLLIAKVFIKSK